MGTVVIGLVVNHLDLTLEQDEGGGVDSRIVSMDRMDEGREHSASQLSTSGVAIGHVGYRDGPTGEYSRSPRFGVMFTQIYFLYQSVESTSNTGGEEIESVDASGGMWRYTCGLGPLSPYTSDLGDAKETTQKFDPLKAALGAIPAVYANREVRSQPLFSD